MKFVKITGAVLSTLTDDAEMQELRAAGVNDDSEIRINEQGDIEVLKHGHWSIIGGLLGDFQHRIKRLTGLDWT